MAGAGRAAVVYFLLAARVRFSLAWQWEEARGGEGEEGREREREREAPVALYHRNTGGNRFRGRGYGACDSLATGRHVYQGPAVIRTM